jgi:hypothetical protein
METRHYSLGINETSKLLNIIRIAFGFACLLIGIFWLIFNIKSIKTDGALWITIIFLSVFGFYQIWSGLGHASMFIEIGPDLIILKKSPVLSPVKYFNHEIDRIELYPMNVVFILKSKKKIMLRFGSTFYETNEKIKDQLFSFTELNEIPMEIIEEKL